MKKSLVSIIIPCYNGEKTIGRMLESVIAQTYRPIELIVVNDGSTDNSEEVIKSYIRVFEDSGIMFQYVFQENLGLGGAINTGLKRFTGDYLCWADCDDYYHKDSIGHRVNFLENHPDYAVVTSNAYYLHENELEKKVDKKFQLTEKNQDENQFWYLLVADSIFCPGCHMVRTEAFLDVNPTRSIYPARRGQNWQLLLPVYYKYKRYFMDEPLYYYVIYANSMSKDTNYEQEIYRCEEHEKIIFETLENMDIVESDLKKAEKLVQILYARKRMYIYVRNGFYSKARKQYKVLRQLKNVTFKDWCASHLKVYNLYVKMRR